MASRSPGRRSADESTATAAPARSAANTVTFVRIVRIQNQYHDTNQTKEGDSNETRTHHCLFDRPHGPLGRARPGNERAATGRGSGAGQPAQHGQPVGATRAGRTRPDG